MYTAVYMRRVITCHGSTAQQQSAFTLEAGPAIGNGALAGTRRSISFFLGMYPYIVRTYLVSYCRSVRPQQRFNDPTLKPISVFFFGMYEEQRHQQQACTLLYTCVT